MTVKAFKKVKLWLKGRFTATALKSWFQRHFSRNAVINYGHALKHLNVRPKPSIRELKKNARETIKQNRRISYMVGFIRAAIGFFAFAIGFPPFYVWLDLQAKLSTNPNLQVPDINVTPIWLGAAMVIISALVFDVLLTARLLPDNRKAPITPGSKSDGQLFGFDWISTNMTMFINRCLWACLGFIPLFITLELAGHNIGFWYIMFIVSILTSVIAYLWSKYRYILSVMEAIDGYLDEKQAMATSRQRMKGHKLQMFVLMLSFIGWDFLNICFVGLFNIYVVPYRMATIIEFRKELLKS